MNLLSSTQLIEQIAHIKRMERSNLTLMSSGPQGPHYKPQAWENGKHVSRDQADAAASARVDGGLAKVHVASRRAKQT